MKNTKKIIISIYSVVIIVVLAVFIFYSKKEPAQQQKTLDTIIINTATSTVNDSLFSSFMCPDDYKTKTEQINALADFFGTYQKADPNATMEDMQIYRYKFLVSHSCDQTLKNMQQDIMPDTSPMIRFVGKDFGPQFTQFDANSKLWTTYYTQGNQAEPNEGLIISFFLKNIWSDKIITAKNVANFFAKTGDVKILTKFETPDTANNGADYFIVSDEIYPEQNIAYVNLTKISQVQDGVVSVTYSRKMPNDKVNLDKNVNDWLTQDLKLKDGATTEMNNIRVDPTWIDYLSKQKITLQESSQNSFKCPGSYATSDEYLAGLEKFEKQEVSNNPNITIRGIFEDRYAFLVLKNCTEDLQNIQDKLPPGSGTTTEDIIQNEMDEYNSGSYTPASTDTSIPTTNTDDPTTTQAITLNFLTH